MVLLGFYSCRDKCDKALCSISNMWSYCCEGILLRDLNNVAGIYGNNLNA